MLFFRHARARDTHAPFPRRRQAELERSRDEQARLFGENATLRGENDQLRAALRDGAELARCTRANYCARVDADELSQLPEADLAELFAAAVDAHRAAAGEQKRRLDAQRHHVLCVDCGARTRTKMAAPCSHLLYCHGCVPGGSSVCPLCDAVVLADQWVHVRHV